MLLNCGIKYLCVVKSCLKDYIKHSNIISLLDTRYVVYVSCVDSEADNFLLSHISNFLPLCLLAEGLYQSDYKRRDHAAVQSGAPHGAL